MKNSPFFSVVIPTYNRASLIPLTVNSFLEQTFFEFEVIIVDDGSTDNTAAVIHPFLCDDRVKYVAIKNSERGAARNFGAKTSRGAYINFFDSDDTAYPHHLQSAYETLIALNKPEVVHLGYDIKYPNGKQIRVVNDLASPINAELINGNHLSCNGVFLRRDIAQSYPFSENRILSASEDYALWLRLAARFSIYSSTLVTSTIINHELRSVLNINFEKFIERMECLKKELQSDEMVRTSYGKKWNDFIAYRDIYIALHLAMAKLSKTASLRYLYYAARLKPNVVLSRRFLAALKNIIL